MLRLSSSNSHLARRLGSGHRRRRHKAELRRILPASCGRKRARGASATGASIESSSPPSACVGAGVVAADGCCCCSWPEREQREEQQLAAPPRRRATPGPPTSMSEQLRDRERLRAENKCAKNRCNLRGKNRSRRQRRRPRLFPKRNETRKKNSTSLKKTCACAKKKNSHPPSSRPFRSDTER